MSLSSEQHLAKAPLGKKASYTAQYAPQLLFPISRQQKRDELAIVHPLPFYGYDAWNAFELSWLNPKGKPVVAMAEIIFPCDSPNIIESKSLKLYLNSYNNTKFLSTDEVLETLERDLSKSAGAHTDVKIITAEAFSHKKIGDFDGICLDHLDIACDTYEVDANFLQTNNDEIVEETLYSHLLKSNCLVTGQPDWASIQIHYKGKSIDHGGLLKYIVSYRNHNEFHEQCVERIFVDIIQKCHPEQLTVYARYTRRGGLDINPIRSTEALKSTENSGIFRQ